MPPVSFGAYLLQHLDEIGPTIDGRPITHQDIDSWARLTGRVLDRWETRVLHDLSRAYAVQQQLSSDPNCKAPWSSIEVTTKDGLISKFEEMKGQQRVRRSRLNKVVRSR